jgi:predicted phage terminase large subunit-like protein
MNSYSPSQQEAALELLNRRKARRELQEFAKRVKPGYISTPHTEVLCRYLQEFADGRIKRLRIDMPPRHGKSTHVSEILPAFLLGKHPDEKVISATHTASLAHDMCGTVQKIMDGPEYPSVFPDARISPVMRQSDRFNILGHKGKYLSVGVREAVSGYGMHKGLVDDVYPSRFKAQSAAYRREVEEWLDGSFMTRAENEQAGLLVTTTRWHKADISAYVVRHGEWVILVLPAICTNPSALGEFRKLGEPLWPERFGIDYLKAEEEKNRFEFATQYQQDPKERAEGALFKRHYFNQRLDEIPVLDFWVRWWDIASGTSDAADRTAGALVGRIKEGKFAGKWVIADLQYGRWAPHERNRMIRAVAESDIARVSRDGKQFGQMELCFEKGWGSGADMTGQLSAALDGFSFTPVTVKQSKGFRADPFAAQCEAGNVVLVNGRWVEDFLDEAVEFDPVGNTHLHDDLVDAPVGAYTFHSQWGPK